MTAVNGFSFTYDNDGNMLTQSLSGTLQWTFTYDYENRMLSYTGSSTSGTNSYTGLGGRYVKGDSLGGRYQYATDDGATSSVISDGSYFYNPTFGQQLGGTDVSYVPDRLGSTTSIASPSQTLESEFMYDAWGEPLVINSPIAFPIGEENLFGAGQGYQSDNDDNLLRCGNRYYYPAFGRFLTQDPAGSGDNWYTYCDNDPVDEADPDGLAGVEPISNLNGTQVWVSGTTPAQAEQWLSQNGTPGTTYAFSGFGSNVPDYTVPWGVSTASFDVSAFGVAAAYHAAFREALKRLGTNSQGWVKGPAKFNGTKWTKGKMEIRLDGAHIVRPGRPDGEYGVHVNYSDWTNGNWNNGAGPGVKGVIPVEGATDGEGGVSEGSPGDGISGEGAAGSGGGGGGIKGEWMYDEGE